MRRLFILFALIFAQPVFAVETDVHPCKADINQDGVVNHQDLQIIANRVGTCQPMKVGGRNGDPHNIHIVCTGDANGDGEVTVQDFMDVMRIVNAGGATCWDNLENQILWVRASDVDGNYVVDANDLIYILNRLGKYIEIEGIEGDEIWYEGDVDGSGIVDKLDLIIVVYNLWEEHDIVTRSP